MTSGSDTTLKGAVVSAPQITANVGNDLHIESLQDASRFDSRQNNIGGSISASHGKMSGSLSIGKSKTDSDYASVQEQSGLRAGDQGFNVNVANDTDLKGSAITSTQAAIADSKNSFTTGGELSTSDIQNQASYKASSVGVNVGAGTSLDGKLAPQGTSAGIGTDSGNASSTTTAVISGIAGNKAARTGDAETGIAKIFDADKVQKDIDAQVQITQEFGRAAGKLVSDDAQSQRKDLQERLKQADETDRQAIQAQLEDVTMQERVMNVLIGAVSGFGGTALTRESLSAAAGQMRQLMIEDSQRFAGVTDRTTTLSNVSGASEGMREDGFKIGGTRIDLDLMCGVDNKRCLRNEDGSLRLNKNGQVQFDPKSADGKSLAEFIETTEEGKKMSGLTGGIQGWKGTLFGIPYPSGSWPDKLVEAFSGTHDMVGGKLSGLYDEQGNATRDRGTMEKTAQEAWSATGAIVASAPFAMAEFLSPEVWKAIAILLGAAK